jgi:general secretion pathway protein H
MASAGVSFALRDSAQTQLEREGLRLAALLESARARSLASGVAVRWRTTENGFVFDGLPAATLPEGWLSADVSTAEPARLLLGPEPIIAPQNVQLVSRSQGAHSLTVGTDGLRPFVIVPGDGPNGTAPRAP